MPQCEEKEIKEIDRLALNLYSCISFKEGSRPDLDTFKRLFIPDGMLIDNNYNPPMITRIDQFIDVFNEEVSHGSMKSLFEKELWNRTELFGKIAHRVSTYEARLDPSDPEPFSLGINSIQFINIDNFWRINSIIWYDQTENFLIPKKYLI